jgi:hypothetical protein
MSLNIRNYVLKMQSSSNQYFSFVPKKMHVNYIGYYVLTPVTMKNTVFWDVVPCSLIQIRRLFGAT